MPSKLDAIYRRLLITKFFEKGWGKPENLERLFNFRKILSNRKTCLPLIPKDYPIEITRTEKSSDYTLIDAHFISPLELYLPGLIPKEARHAYFQVVLPNQWKDKKHKPMCIHLAGTGDHYFWRRRNFIAKPLLREANIGAILLENPFYGSRKPDDQVRSNLHNVSDIFVMGGCLIMESVVLLHWCERMGFGPLGLTGLSMGGHMASLGASNWPKPIVLVPCLSWTTAAATFTQGVMSHSINWDMLETQYFSDGNYCERLSKMVTIVDDAFIAGQKFIKDFNQSLKELRTDIHYAKGLKNIAELKWFPDRRASSQILSKGNQQADSSTNRKYNSNKIISETSSKITDDEIKDGKTEEIKETLGVSTSIMAALTQSSKLNSIIPTKDENKEKLKIENELEESTLTKLMRYILPTSQSQSFNEMKIDICKTKWWEREALQFMRGVMDECTHLKNFSVPFDTSLVIAVCAKDDAYVPRDGCSSLEDIWPGVEVRYLDAGHVSAYVLHQKLFRNCIIEAFERAKNKYETENLENVFEKHEITITFAELKAKYDNLVKKMKESA